MPQTTYHERLAALGEHCRPLEARLAALLDNLPPLVTPHGQVIDFSWAVDPRDPEIITLRAHAFEPHTWHLTAQRHGHFAAGWLLEADDPMAQLADFQRQLLHEPVARP